MELSAEGSECFHQKTDDIISIHHKAPSGNKRLIVESMMMINASRESEEPPIFFAFDMHNVFLHLEALQQKMCADPNASSPLTFRVVCKPNEVANNHTIMCEVEIYREKIVLAAVDSYQITWEVNTDDILKETAAKFPQLKMEMGVCLNETQKRMGCMQFSLANAELIPTKSLQPLKEKIKENGEGCIVVEDNLGKLLPLQSYLYSQDPDAIKDLLKNENFGNAEDRELLWANGKNHRVTDAKKPFINSIASYKLETLRKLLEFLEKMEKEDGAGEKLAAAIRATVICPDQSWRKPLAKALAELWWTPEDETSNLTAAINDISANKSPAEKSLISQKIAMDFMEALPHLQSSRLRDKSKILFEEALAGTVPEQDREVMLRNIVQIFRDNRELITEKEFDWLNKLIEKHTSDKVASLSALLRGTADQ